MASLCLQPTTLAAGSGSTPYNTYLATTATGENAQLNVPAWQTFVPSTTLNYQNVTVTVTPSTSTGGGTTAPLGTYSVTGGSTKANILWDNSHQPTRTCEVACPWACKACCPAQTALSGSDAFFCSLTSHPCNCKVLANFVEGTITQGFEMPVLVC